MDISIIIPAHNEEGNVVPLYKELKAVLGRLKKSYEIIFIDDGSTDSTFAKIKALNSKDKTIRCIRFRKNFGQTAGIDAGFKMAKGNVIIPIDADLPLVAELELCIRRVCRGVMICWRVRQVEHHRERRVCCQGESAGRLPG